MDVTPMDLLALIEQELRDKAVLVNKILVGPPMTHWRVLLALEDANKKQQKIIKFRQKKRRAGKWPSYHMCNTLQWRVAAGGWPS